MCEQRVAVRVEVEVRDEWLAVEEMGEPEAVVLPHPIVREVAGGEPLRDSLLGRPWRPVYRVGAEDVDQPRVPVTELERELADLLGGGYVDGELLPDLADDTLPWRLALLELPAGPDEFPRPETPLFLDEEDLAVDHGIAERRFPHDPPTVTEPPKRTGTNVKGDENVPHTMGDTKRGRERKGMKKMEQRQQRELERTLTADDEMPDIYDEETVEIDVEPDVDD